MPVGDCVRASSAGWSKGGMQVSDVRITASRNGPYLVSGLVELTDADGKTYPVKAKMALCRCGASTTKPFCDGTHSRIGFQAAEQAVPASAE
jgi:3-phenylpropionate/trans-cinnamate dioxygenase ferredoxin subunit